jgi:(p)ppGpp synthase/HD superfamily hydrolase
MTTAQPVSFDLDIVRSIAGDALAGLQDKAGNPVFWHAADIAHDLERAGKSTATVAVALLHDVLEDSDWDAQRLHRELVTRGSSKLDVKKIVTNVMALTRRQGEETYAEYIARVEESSDIAVQVKIADLRHHLKDTGPLSESLKRRYTNALASLT